MRALRLAPLLVLALVLSGCFQTRTLVRVNADGSGTIEETVLMNSALLIGALGFNPGAEMEPNEDGLPYSSEQLKSRAADFGEAVALSGVESVEVLFGDGYRATYAFDDVRTLRIPSDFSGAMPTDLGGAFAEGMESEDDQEEDKKPITFGFEPGQLTIRMPRPDASDSAIEVDGEEASGSPAGEEGMMLRMMRDMRLTLAVEMVAPIAQTNASHREGQTLTLFDLEVGKVLATPGAMDQLERLAPDGPGQLTSDKLALISEVDGVLFEPMETVTVDF